ncbi:carbon-nitrogen family hydrolase [Micromonospora sp. NPDC005161]
MVMKTALVQVASPFTEPVEGRIERVGDLVAGLTDVDLVVLPELWAPGYFAFDRYDELAQHLDGPLLSTIRGWARALGAHLHAGSVLERDPTGRLHNTAVLVDPTGEVLLDYRKIHVFGYQSLESKLLSAGQRADVADTALGQVGMTTCYDLRFPELYRHLVDQGAELVIVPAAWPAARLEHWKLFTRTRAVENQLFLLACNAAGKQGDVELAGHSVVVDPWGRVLAEAGAGEEVLYTEIDRAAVTEIRREFPVLEDRRLRNQATFG